MVLPNINGLVNARSRGSFTTPKSKDKSRGTSRKIHEKRRGEATTMCACTSATCGPCRQKSKTKNGKNVGVEPNYFPDTRQH